MDFCGFIYLRRGSCPKSCRDTWAHRTAAVCHRGARYGWQSRAQRWRQCEHALPLRTERSPPVLSKGCVCRQEQKPWSPIHLRVDHKLLERGQKDRLVPAQRAAHCAAPSSKSTPHAAYSGTAAARATQQLHATLHASRCMRHSLPMRRCVRFPKGRVERRGQLYFLPRVFVPLQGETAPSHDDASRSGTEVRRRRASANARWLSAAVTVTTWRFSATAERASLFMRLARSSHT